MRGQDEGITKATRGHSTHHGYLRSTGTISDHPERTIPELPPIPEQIPLTEEDLADWRLAEEHLLSHDEGEAKVEHYVSSEETFSEETSKDDLESSDTESFRSVFSSFDIAPVLSASAHKEPREERCVWSVPPVSKTTSKPGGGPRDSFVGFLDLLAKASTETSFYSPASVERARRGRRFRRPGLKVSCRLLDLPPELRNRIYDTVYPLHSKKHASPFEIVNPEPDFLLTCRQIYTECREIYEEAHRHLWAKSHFWIKSPGTTPAELRRLNKNDLNLITHATVRIETEGVMTLANLIDVRGGWKVDYINTRPGQGGPGVPGGVRTEYVSVHQRPSGTWKGMTWMDFHQSEPSMTETLGRALARSGAYAGVRDQILQILLVTPRDVERVAVRTCWRSVLEP